ncbi:hypothetical protein SAY86_027318 [Trapa natans]|uniref:Uncharacterized protein n=1 Tax=Trapa natans TaxID=22666 RepID=A0AAN7KHB3_TRANT|nr:hypothetical protein SAY86_027318 [Trapa natans]
MDETSHTLSHGSATGVSVMTWPEHLLETDDEVDEFAQLSSGEFCGFNEELVQKVMQELYKEITMAVEDPPTTFLTAGRKDGNCELTIPETASSMVMAGAHFASDNGINILEEIAGLPELRSSGGSMQQYGHDIFGEVKQRDEMGKWLEEMMEGLDDENGEVISMEYGALCLPNCIFLS